MGSDQNIMNFSDIWNNCRYLENLEISRKKIAASRKNRHFLVLVFLPLVHALSLLFQEFTVNYLLLYEVFVIPLPIIFLQGSRLKNFNFFGFRIIEIF